MPGLSSTMHEDHERLDALGERLLAPSLADDRDALARAFGEFEHALLSHMEVEELYLLPALERVDTAEAASLRSDHAKLRRLVAEVSAGVGLGVVREHGVRQVVHFLRSHTAVEELSLYRWAERNAPAAVKAAVLDRVAEGERVRQRATDSRPGAASPPDTE